MLDHLNWELSVLSRAVAFANLSGAASQIGISQPQLSRIVAKIEADLSITLLDREAKRKSSWTPEAHRLAEIYTNLLTRFRTDIHRLTESTAPTNIHVGALEGMLDCALKLCDAAFTHPSVNMVELVIGDLDALEERYYKGSLDFLFSLRVPGRKKPRRSHTIGYQSMVAHGEKNTSVQVLSSFEYSTTMTTLKPIPGKKILVSNSLTARAHWFQTRSGHGTLPSEIYPKSKRKDGELPAVLIGSDLLPESFWEEAVNIKW